jgi:acetyltransferase-like isoleucine patch superfamily enzyme
MLLNNILESIKRKMASITSKSYIKYLRNKGVTIGHDCTFYSPSSHCIDLSNPELIEIGNRVNITMGCVILTHGYDWSVLLDLHPGELFGSAGHVVIGNNVYIGMRTTILKGVRIGDNVVIGAGSVVDLTPKYVPSSN